MKKRGREGFEVEKERWSEERIMMGKLVFDMVFEGEENGGRAVDEAKHIGGEL